jgi:hypothetical protein
MNVVGIEGSVPMDNVYVHQDMKDFDVSLKFSVLIDVVAEVLVNMVGAIVNQVSVE